MTDILTDYQPRHHIEPRLGWTDFSRGRKHVATGLGTGNLHGKWFNESYVGRHSVDHSTSQLSAANPQELS